MIFGRTTRTFLAISSILLVGGASLPEVICCCNISWGPGGLLGNSNKCVMDCSSDATLGSCCCHDSACESKDRSTLAECSGSHCECSFSLASPPPMTGSYGASLDIGNRTLSASLGAWFSLQELAGIFSAESHLRVRTGCILTPGARCALFQSWLA
jgi:hypothetical protein